MTLWVENASKLDIANGTHSTLGPNTWLIQIATPATEFPTPKNVFSRVSQFEFIDAEDSDDYPDECKFSDDQAKEVIAILQEAKLNGMNVLVHCNLGICRSGAVTEVATMIGFTATQRHRQPNLRVKRKLMEVLGLTY